MKGWRSKLIFVLTVYFAGFATAIYLLAPTPKEGKPLALGSLLPSGPRHAERLTKEEFVESFNAGLHKAVALGKVAALHTSRFIKERLREASDACNRAPH